MKTVRAVTAVLVAVLGLGCAASDESREYTPGAAMRSNATVEGVANTARVIYQVPATDDVRVARNLEYAEGRVMDVYYPPDFDASTSLPAVVVATAYDKTTSGRQIGWGLLLTSHGLIGITFKAPYPDRDARELFRYLHVEGQSLGVDSRNLGVISWCSHCSVAAKVLSDVSEPYHAGIRYGVLLYGMIPKVEALRPGQELLVVRAGKDTSATPDTLDAFVDQSRALGASVEVIDYRDGCCGFDFTEAATSFSVFVAPAGRERDVEMIRTVLRKIQEHLLGSA